MPAARWTRVAKFRAVGACVARRVTGHRDTPGPIAAIHRDKGQTAPTLARVDAVRTGDRVVSGLLLSLLSLALERGDVPVGIEGREAGGPLAPRLSRLLGAGDGGLAARVARHITA